MTTLDSWQPFLSTVAESAATLTGLVFVATSINLKTLLEAEGRTSLAAEALLQLLGPTVLALTALVPGQPLPLLGAELLFLNGVLWFTQTRLHVIHIRRHSGQPVSWVLKRILRTHAATLPAFIAAVLLFHASLSGMPWLAASFFFSFYAGIANSWVILIEILR